MKLRILGNSIRLRLTKSELAQFAQTGSVEETVEFGSADPVLRYLLYADQHGDTVQAMYQGNCLRISVPTRDAENWIKTEQVGIEAAQSLGDDRSLRILIEKDFACLTERGDEDETDTFQNPTATGTY